MGGMRKLGFNPVLAHYVFKYSGLYNLASTSNTSHAKEMEVHQHIKNVSESELKNKFH